jgi:uncharacterized protein YneF (UPF0154 family)
MSKTDWKISVIQVVHVSQTESEKDLVIELAKKNPRSISTIMAILFEETGKHVSETTIKRILKAAGFIWKRVAKIYKRQTRC